jgi:hypothetical protein
MDSLKSIAKRNIIKLENKKGYKMNSIEKELGAVIRFIYFVVETGQLAGKDNDFLKAMYYDFESQELINKTSVDNKEV